MGAAAVSSAVIVARPSELRTHSSKLASRDPFPCPAKRGVDSLVRILDTRQLWLCHRRCCSSILTPLRQC